MGSFRGQLVHTEEMPDGAPCSGGQQCGSAQKTSDQRPMGKGAVSKATMPHFHLLDPEAKPQMFSKAQT